MTREEKIAELINIRDNFNYTLAPREVFDDAIKALKQEPITSKDKFIYALTACGCLLKDGKTWYEHNELIKCFEDLGLFEQEPILDKLRERVELEKLGYPPSAGYYKAIMKVLQLIDKYKAETEET